MLNSESLELLSLSVYTSSTQLGFRSGKKEETMGASLPLAVPVPYKSRRGWLIAFGIAEILIGCSFLLMLGMMALVFYGPVAARMPAEARPAGPFSTPLLMGFAVAQYGVMAAIFFTAGIGSLRCRNWARILMLVVSSLWLAIGVISTVVMAIMFPIIMRQQGATIPPGIEHAAIVGMIVIMASLGIVLPAIFLIFYTRKNVKATCLARNAAQAPADEAAGASTSGLPVPLAILGGWEALSALSVFAALFMRMVMMFGVVLHGAAAVLVLLAYSVLSGAAAWLIFRRKVLGWTLALFKTGFWTVSLIVSCFHVPDMGQAMRDIGYDANALQIYEQVPHFMVGVLVGTILMMTGLLIFILYSRKFFPAELQA